MNNFGVTALQRFNAEFVRDTMWPSVPPERVIYRLAAFRGRLRNGDCRKYTTDSEQIKNIDCKTIACFGGWVAINPYFQSLGVYPGSEGEPCMRGCSRPSEVSYKLFGDHELFYLRENNERGHEHDHKVVMRRIKKLISESFVRRHWVEFK